jgi:error-prone DNA polymerase
MGFYAPAQLVRDARGVEVRPLDVNRSQWDCTLEKTVTPYHAVRLGFCMVRSLKQKDAEQLVDRRTYDRIAATRSEKTFTSIEDVWRRAGVPMAMLYHIAAADGFHGLGLSRRDAAWAIKGLRDEALPLFAAADDRAGLLRPEALEPRVTLAPMTQGHEVVEDYRSTGLSLRAHPLAFLRQTNPRTARLRTMPRLEGNAERSPPFDRWSRSRPADAGLGQGRHVHHARR